MTDATPPTVADVLARLREQRAARNDPALFRVVEVSRDAGGRLVRNGRIWHADLDHVRRFGRALAANTAARQVLVADAHGAVLERIAVAGGSATAAGWSNWREAPLSPLAPSPSKRSPGVPAHRVDLDVEPVG